MRISTPGLAGTGLALLLLGGCGGGGGNGNNPGTPAPAPTPTLTFTAAPTSITTGGNTTLTWSSTNVGTCTASDGWSGAKAANGSEQINNLQATTTYTLACTSAVGGAVTAPQSVVVTVTTPPANSAPTANAGPSRTVVAGSSVWLSGEASFDPEGDPLQFTWTQTGGPTVALTAANAPQALFTSPAVTSNTNLTFSLTVTDGKTAASSPSTVTITLVPLAAGNVIVQGRITFVRIPFSAQDKEGLNFLSPVPRPARGIVVAANSAGTSTQLASGETDWDGNFALSVPQNSPIDLLAVARMARDGSVPLPHWNFSVVDADVNTTPYSFTDGAFNSSTGLGVTHNMTIPSGLDGTGTAIATRASAPFAVLDTVYSALQTVVGVAPTTNFPALLLDWAPNNPGGQTFFSGGSPQKIVLSAVTSEDTDEFDQHVIAHEFGHYIEHNFSRADNIGGGHGIGDKLDIRVAFGEGFGYAFAAIALKDPVARDSFVDTGCNNPPSNQCSSIFNVETNPPLTGNGGNFGCWCSESTVWSLLWDLYDGAADTNDTVALGFKPMWDVLINEQRTTPAFTSIFSFTTALRAAQPSKAAAIDALLNAQNITAAGMDAIGSTETHVPTPVASAAALPVYTPLTAGTPVTLRSVDDAGHYNKLGNHRFVRYVKSGSGTQTVTVTTTGADPDVIVYRNGDFTQSAEGPGNETFNISAAGTYLFDVYECANGCSAVQGTPGDYDVTVTVN